VTTRRHPFILLGVENFLSLPPMKRASKDAKPSIEILFLIDTGLGVISSAF
jgi:hypothetical protein